MCVYFYTPSHAHSSLVPRPPQFIFSVCIQYNTPTSHIPPPSILHTHPLTHPHPYTHRPVNLEVLLPTMEDHVDFTAHFPQGCQAVNCLEEKVDLPCTLEFSSSQPVSRMDYITFSDKTTGKRCVCVCQLSHLQHPTVILYMFVAGVQLQHS